MEDDDKKTWVEIDPSEDSAPKVEESTPKKQEDAPPEEPVGKRAERRIKQLVGKTKDLEAELFRAREEAEKARKEAAEVLKSARGQEDNAASALLAAAKEKVELAKKRFTEAYDTADKEGLAKANADWIDAQLEVKALELRPKSAVEEAPKKVEERREPAAPNLPQATQDWVSRQPWFGRGEGKDIIATNAAIAISDVLLAEGYDVNDSEFYEELEDRLKSELPRSAKLLSGGGTEKPRSPVGGQSRTPTTSKNTVRLDSGDQIVARRMGVTEKEFARQRLLAEEAGEGYVTIDTTRRK